MLCRILLTGHSSPSQELTQVRRLEREEGIFERHEMYIPLHGDPPVPIILVLRQIWGQTVNIDMLINT